jgi:formylglycine-generating enzyme required for sulfatase activity
VRSVVGHRERASALGALMIASALLVGCQGAEPRAQLLIVVDTDAPVPAELLSRLDFSGDAAIDTLRVDAFAEGWAQPFDLRDFIAPDPADWPLSFGVATDELPLDRPVRLRLRAFRGRFAARGELDGIATLDPPREVTIDRLVEIPPSTDGIRRVRVTLTAACMGVRSVFDPTSPTTCTSESRAAAPSSEIDEVDDDDLPSRVGTTPLALETPCPGTPPEGAVCIPGGLTILGEQSFEGVGNGSDELDPIPLRPALLSPFYLDRTEITVGRFRALFEAGLIGTTPPVTKGDPLIDSSEYCTWLGPGQAAHDALPLNCLGYPTAVAICEALGGALPTEAQWEHAARGRGRRSLYPWGNYTPNGASDCCIVSASRKSTPDIPVVCPDSGVEPPGSHPASPACGGIGDESRDGVLDLGGSLTEAMRDSLKPYDADCWSVKGGGLLTDPFCDDPGSVLHAVRGGNWNGGQARTAVPFRSSFNANRPTSGLRCAYEAKGKP